jgi:superfamily I DNA/RNA helicase
MPSKGKEKNQMKTEFKPSQYQQDIFDFVQTGTDSGMIEAAYGLIKHRVACRILGRDIGVGLENLIKQMKAKDIDHLEEWLDVYLNREIAKLTSKGKEDKAQAVDDRVTTLRCIISHLDEGSQTIDGLIKSIQQLFTDNNKGLLTLATVHKSKGLEFSRVFILGRHKYMPSCWARKQWQKQQEVNLIYVAYTRTKQELYFLPEGFHKAETKEKDNE